MAKITKFPFKKQALLGLAVVGFCLYAGDSMAQSEGENSEMEQEKPIDRPVFENQADHGDMQVQDVRIPAAATVTSSKPAAPKKETQVSGEGKKAETAPSTLSFNIFLYIVDKFKAD
ncbi:hypothetical protein PBT90_17455 [Algoriphagus halophytocola]|uniref:Uncharacterized protein n=1 Tax=Algoriphagus halophytocola TaxID=2991499 RepID=A0ABY6MG63_9BACT|nr:MULTISPECIES: hypothetical protein [unclassified Algoriphagus]UZD21311.1 hypothetical protein OM944_11590 [Algoriphagus sp. TR-M5]WBL42522.1 hypothetical protein PBT90_17455 [Algoriphagus sp. TR-M9]